LHIDFEHPVNARVLTLLRSRDPGTRLPPSAAPDEVTDPYYTLGTHPDLVERLWDKLGGILPVDCRWVVYGRPVLAHPQTGIIFGLASGTLVYALRLPELERAEAIANGSKRTHTYSNGSVLNVEEIGDEWVLGSWLSSEAAYCLAAYRLAGDTR
jgi:hypothetical protein